MHKTLQVPRVGAEESQVIGIAPVGLAAQLVFDEMVKGIQGEVG
jgi:hypothetical protein